ncbi:hypothetical protein T265_02502 [Opisthorchis viverrini]|uniref:Uncharacterized protein n=1 Tax=Opisthorchis viverrini TaxID=6198 RepID=A0A075A6E5_OPIVI|nr:hypothetical protein T265_02502 [Opisthorchis viverrini]KER31175.1 hypothetical protein T265_02502 [Opisthorchis viverrini]
MKEAGKPDLNEGINSAGLGVQPEDQVKYRKLTYERRTPAITLEETEWSDQATVSKISDYYAMYSDNDQQGKKTAQIGRYQDDQSSQGKTDNNATMDLSENVVVENVDLINGYLVSINREEIT